MTEWCCKPDCPGRHPACHDRCEKYREWRGRLCWKDAWEELREVRDR